MKKKILSLCLVICIILCSTCQILVAVTTYQKGDANKDGMITSEDASIIYDIYLYEIEVDEEMLEICDIDGDGKITATDGFLVMDMIKHNNTIKGDINQDGQITKDDGLLLAELFLNDNINNEDKELVDMNSDGIINIKDAQEIYYMVDPDFILGDINKDNIINIADLTYLYVKIENNDFTTEEIIYCDYFGDGSIDEFEVDMLIDYFENDEFKYKGDANRDGAINSIDASMVIDKYKNNNVYKDDLNRADMNGDNSLTSIDASMIIDIYKNNE